MKVTIKSITDYEFDVYNCHEITSVEIDGKRIGGGWYGCEPEDNRRCRTYKWVEQLLKTLAEKLGAEVEIQIIEIEHK